MNYISALIMQNPKNKHNTKKAKNKKKKTPRTTPPTTTNNSNYPQTTRTRNATTATKKCLKNQLQEETGH
jgi:hypothetical protein